MKTTLLVVANRSRARIFTFDTPGVHLSHEEDLWFSLGKDHDKEFSQDDQGRSFDRLGPHRHRYSNQNSTDQQLMDRFVQDIALNVEKRRNKVNRFSHLILAGDPKFIGNLRQNLSNKSQQLTLDLIPKDIVNERQEDIKQRVMDLLKDYPEILVET